MPAALDGPTSRGAAERNQNERRIASTPRVTPTFVVYKDDEVALRLRELFDGKCAYCEGKPGAYHPFDVEHFRPKGKVRQSRDHPPQAGYWWLAADWNNLYPSCIDCNRARYHDQFQHGRTGREMRGKENLFPLAPPVCTEHVPGCEVCENALLLDPCRDDPSEALAWTDTGVVKPRKNAVGQPHPKAQPSIDCFGLDRHDLFLMRRDHATEVCATIERLKVAEDRVRTYPNDASFRQDVQNEMERLRRYAFPKEPWAAMCREIINNLYRPI